MQITRIDLVGRLEEHNPPKYFATIYHIPGADYIGAKMKTSSGPDSESIAEATAEVADMPAVFALAQDIQQHLNGDPGDILQAHDYFQLLRNMID